ncbi:hypothetical protein KRP22_008506 [Phytophthora ramorum]|uniref:uncharacterized protein n=1 Tax=Phytophthora ramorum TaxID=164328 RepID=UPI0030AFFA49|nr:hypothetical protein KRP23_2799 [Phytophthora ramorum]KAH7501863.1 hypothetical protein KRP22_7339 [Phytophthora ramorum]
MGNRPSRKKQRASAAVSAPSEEAVAAAPAPSPAASAQPESALAARKYESPAKRKESELPLSARQAPPTARDDGNNEDDPLQFFRQCYALEEDPFALYTQALLLKDQREFAAASELLRSLLPNASLSLEAHYHLAQCLVAQDPALRSCREEATQCLESVVVATKASSTSADAHQAIMYRDSLELLAHVMIAGRRFDRALELLDLLQAHINTDAVPPNQAAYRQQQTLVSFQRAFCRYARGDPPEAISSELLGVPPHKPEQQQGEEQDELEVPDPLESIELLLHADAASLHEGFALLVATST